MVSSTLPILDADREERSPQDQNVVLQVYHEVSVLVSSLVLEVNVVPKLSLEWEP